SQDATHLAAQAVNPGRLELWDLRQSQKVWTVPRDRLIASFLAFLDSGATLLTAGNSMMTTPPPQENTFHFWDVATGKELRSFDAGPGNLRNITLSPAHDRIAFGYWGVKGPESRISVCDVATGKKIRELVGVAKKEPPAGQIYFSALTFSGDG